MEHQKHLTWRVSYWQNYDIESWMREAYFITGKEAAAFAKSVRRDGNPPIEIAHRLSGNYDEEAQENDEREEGLFDVFSM